MFGSKPTVGKRLRLENKRLGFETLEQRVVLSASTAPLPDIEVAPLPQTGERDVYVASSLDPSVIQWVQSLTYQQFALLSEAEAVYLTSAQVASIPTTNWFATMSAQARGALTPVQVESLTTGAVSISLLTPQQIGWLTPTQIQKVLYQDFALLPPNLVPHLTSLQMGSIPTSTWFQGWSAEARAALTPSQVQGINTAAVSISLLTSQQVSWLTANQVQGVSYLDFAVLPASLVPNLTPAQIATIPTTGWLNGWTPAARAALTQSQVQAINTSLVSISAISTQQTSWLTPSQVAQVKYMDFALLPVSQIPHLTPAQIATIPTTNWLLGWTASARAALGPAQVQSLNTLLVSITPLTAQQIGYLTPPQVRNLSYLDFALLPASQVPNLSTAQIATIPTSTWLQNWTASARAALTPTQIQAINTAVVSISTLTAQQITHLTASQVQKTNYLDFALLPASHVPYLTGAQIGSIPTTTYFSNWSTAARGALTTAQVRSLNTAVVSISLLTAQQIGFLTAAQTQQVLFYDFVFIPASHVPYLTTSQIGSIPATNWLSNWSSEARAALTSSQVRSLNTAVISIGPLTAQQISYLTAAQVQQVKYHEFPLLPPSQIPYLTNAQLATMPHPNYLRTWSLAARSQLTESQVTSLNLTDVRLIDPDGAADFDSSHGVDGNDLGAWRGGFGITASAVKSSGDADANGVVDGTDFLMWQRTLGQTKELFSAQQLAWLTPSQIKQVRVLDFGALLPSQIPHLSTTQIASISSISALAAIPPASLAALTTTQVQALDVAAVRINLLTPQQIQALTTAQIRSLAFIDFEYLNPSQIPLLSLEQFAAVTSGTALRQLPDVLAVEFTREQILALSPAAWAAYSVSDAPPSHYHAAVENPIGIDGLPTNEHMIAEDAKFFALVPNEAATHTTVASGDWSNPAIWQNGQVPTAGADVVIGAGTTVRFDAYMNVAVHTVRINGLLTFATNLNTQLKADTIVVDMFGKLHIGTAANPIQNHVTARVLIADGGPIDTIWDPYLLSRGLLSRGEVRMHGKAVTSYTGLAVQPARGATSLYLDSVPVNWKVGDRLVITGTASAVPENRAEEVQILAINGAVVSVSPLANDHLPPGGYGLTVHVANMSRNIQFVAEDSSVIAERPHIVFFHNPNVAIENISVTGFGRTDKSQRISDAVVSSGGLQSGTGLNPRARYAIHFHHTGVNPSYAPATVRGSVVDGSPGWGFVNHSSHVEFENNVAYRVYGSSFTSEDGNEIGLMRGNLSISANGAANDLIDSRKDIHDFGFSGHGFWLQGPGVKLVDNISAGSSGAAFMYFTLTTKNLFDAVNLPASVSAAGHVAIPVGSVPIAQFAGNTAYSTPSGVEVWHHMMFMNDGMSYIDEFTAWNTRSVGVRLLYAGRITIRDAVLLGNLESYQGIGIHTNRFVHDLYVSDSQIEGWEIGIDVPLRRSTVIDGGFIAAVQALFIEKGHDTIRSVDVTGSITFATPSPAQLLGRTPYVAYMSGAYDFQMAAPNIKALLSADRVRFAPEGQAVRNLYYQDQLASNVPFPLVGSPSSVPAGYLGLANWQLWSNFGVAFGGESLLSTSVDVAPDVFGLFRYGT